MLPGAPNILRSSGFNMQVPTSPMSSNNENSSSSSILDGSAAMQQQQAGQQASIAMVPNESLHVNKKPKLEVKQEDEVQQQPQTFQQMLQLQDPTCLNPQVQALLQQQRMKQHQLQLLQSMSPAQRIQLRQQQQLRHQSQQQGMHQNSPNTRSYEEGGCGGVCSRRLMMYLYHLQQRPSENCFSYWRKFVAEYYSSRAKQRLCLSQYNGPGDYSLGMLPPAPDIWHCDLCGAKCGRGFETGFDVLARQFDFKFSNGVIDELLFLDYPRETRCSSGHMMLQYRKVVQMTVHEHSRVVHEGPLRIIFTQDLKILSWEFCAQRHEELVYRTDVAPKANQLLHIAEDCRSRISESGSRDLSQWNLQLNSDLVVAAAQQLVNAIEVPGLNDCGYAKRHIRTLQIAQIVKSLKDLMNFTGEHKIGPIQGLKLYSEKIAAAKEQRQKMQEETGNNTVQNGPMGSDPHHHPQIGHGSGSGSGSGSGQAGSALTNYQSMLLRQQQGNQNPNTYGAGSPSSFSNPSLASSSSFHQRENQPPMFQQHCSHIQTLQNINQAQLQHKEQQMMRQLLQDMSSNNGGMQQPSYSGQSGSNGNNTERNSTPSSSNVSGGGRVPCSNMSVPDRPHDFSGDGFFNNNNDIYR